MSDETPKKPYRAISNENYQRAKQKFRENVIDEIVKIENLIPNTFVDASMNPAGDRLVLTRMDGTTEEVPIDGGAGNIEVGDVTDTSIEAKHGRVLLTWTDPGNVVIEGATLARWAGTLVVRKAGSAPASKTDGTIVVDSTTRNAYASTPYTDTGLTDGTTYYYRFFPHTTGLAYTPGTTLSATPDREEVEIPTAVGQLTYTGSYQEQSFTGYDDTKMTREGVTGGTDAGEYTATYTLFEDYKWSDGTITKKDVKWEIKPQTIANVPSQSGTLTYTGEAQTVTWLNYDATKMDIEGSETETNAGDYTVTITPKSNYAWSNGSQAGRTVTWSIARKIVSIPIVSDRAKTYTTLEQSPTISAYDTAAVNQTGTATAADAGDYTIVFALKSAINAMWSDETTEDKEFSWSIAKATIADVPSQNGTLTYTGAERTPTWADYDPTMLTIGGATSGTNVGEYTATFTPTENFQWPGGGAEAKEVTWTIDKAAGTITTSKNSVSLDTSTLSDTVTVTYAGDGTLSVSSSDTSVATASLSGTTVTINAIGNGTATVTVSATATDNYAAGTAAVSVTAALAPVIKNTLNDNTWEAISYVSKEGTGDTYWDVGDCKEITLNGKIGDYLTLTNEKLCVFILDFNHKMNGANENNIIFGGFKSALTNGVDVALCDSRYGSSYTDGGKCFNMNHKGQTSSSSQAGYYNTNYGGWKGSDLRYDILGATSTPPSQYNVDKNTSNVGYDATEATLTSPKADTFLAALPSDLRSKIRLWTRWVDAVGNTSNVDANIKATVDAVTLLAEPEIFASRNYANQYEQNHNTRMAYYANGNSTVKKKHSDKSTAVLWWECSPSCNNTAAFCRVNTSGGALGTYAGYAYGLATAFKI